MRILQLNFERGWRGGERQTLLTLQHLQEAGHQVSLLARRGEELARRARAAGLTVIDCASAPAAFGYLLRHGRGFDILHAQTASCMSWLAMLHGWLRGRVVFTRRTAFAVDKQRHEQAVGGPLSTKERRTRWKWRRADQFAAISQAAAAEPRRLGLAVQVIPSAIQPLPPDPDYVAALRSRWNPQGLRVLGTTAALTAEKDPLTLIRAVHVLAQRRQDFVFLHFGAEGSETSAAQELVARLGLESRYVLAGFESRPEQVFRMLDGFVLSSRHEALGSSVLDAFVYGVPVVATMAGGLPELLGQGRGQLCAVGDAQALAQAMESLLDQPDAVRQHAEQARRWALQEHSPATMVQRYLRLYGQLLQARRHKRA
ncbi:MAG TPA: glycosyltransferase family 4 protein [Alcaligenes sp.]|nr:glycosyltransferase family 4 protein [Alcaligenes sp.]HRL27033.1 glycosyltransferase family 4 protein [Alcaligenes sp.]